MSGPQGPGVLVRFARYYALHKHSGQDYGGLPYACHLYDVARLGERWLARIDSPSLAHRDVVLAVCWLHDVIEDQQVRRGELEHLFGEKVAEAVSALTEEPAGTRRERHELTYHKIQRNNIALFVKLCDRIANVEHGGPLVAMYRKEQEGFRRALHTDGLFEPMWDHLDALLLPVVSEDGGANQ